MKSKSLFIKFILLIAASLAFIACNEKIDITDISNPDNNTPGNFTGDTVYIQQKPVWGGFNKPQDVLIGREPFVYIADTENDRIVMMNIAGEILGEKQIEKPTDIAQDYKLNLIVIGNYTHTNGQVYSAVYRINMFDAGHIIANAVVERLLPREGNALDLARTDRIYTGVCVFSDNSFLVSRTGPENGLTNPDNAVLVSQENPNGLDTLNNQDKLPLLQPVGTGVLSANGISSLSSMNNSTRDFVMTLIGDDNSFKVQWLRYVQTTEFTGYQNKIEVNSDLMSIDKFAKPMGAVVDARGNLYVADAERDSIYKFNSFGDELESFGGSEIFNQPHGVAHFDNTLFVADTYNDRIVRFILSTEAD